MSTRKDEEIVRAERTQSDKEFGILGVVQGREVRLEMRHVIDDGENFGRFHDLCEDEMDVHRAGAETESTFFL